MVKEAKGVKKGKSGKRGERGKMRLLLSYVGLAENRRLLYSE
jgi:hypothetical protein